MPQSLDVEAARTPWSFLCEDGLSSTPAALEVRNLTYAVSVAAVSRRRPGGMRKVLDTVSCRFPQGKISAVMGATGSGKSSLMCLLRGLSAEGSFVAGDVLCDDRPIDVETMRRVASSVPQEDVFLAALTPREMLCYAAELRGGISRSRMDPNSLHDRVQGVLDLLRLGACADSPIGDERFGLRGISGGERRRLSIGLAIVGGLPRALLCDEPTTGVDSAAAEVIVGILRDFSTKGVTVLCAIHQPSYQLFKSFNSLLLLEAGRALYCGDVANVESYFSRHGAPTPQYLNPAENYIEVVQGSNGPLWAQRWEEEAKLNTECTDCLNCAPLGDDRGKRQLSLMLQTYVLTRRTLKENFRNKRKFFRGMMSRFPAAVMVGFFFWRLATEVTQESIFPMKGVLFMAVQNPLIETFYAGAITFQTTRGLLKREYYDGLYQIAPYYLSYYLGFLAMQLPWTMVWIVPLYVLVGLPWELERFCIFVLTTFLVILMACAAGSAVGATSKDQDGNRAVLTPVLIPMVLFSGYVIPFPLMKPIWRLLYYVSPVQWAMTIMETTLYNGVDFVDCDPDDPGRRCYATGEEYLDANTSALARQLGIGGMLLVCLGYVVMFMLLNIRTIQRSVLDARI